MNFIYARQTIPANEIGEKLELQFIIVSADIINPLIFLRRIVIIKITNHHVAQRNDITSGLCYFSE
jgi:hypothetical protein